MKAFRGSSIGLASIIAIWLASCSHEANPYRANHGQLSASASSNEKIAVLLALSLRDTSLRALLHARISGSTEREKKLHLQTLVAHERGLFQRMATAARLSEPELTAFLNQLPSMEVYLPFGPHRQEWDGTSNLIVATAMSDNDVPYGITLDGREVSLSRQTPPQDPVLAIVPAESFDEAGRSLRPSQDCLPEDPNCGGTGTPAEPGLYLTADYISDLKEPWIKGEPEIEIHTFVRNSSSGDGKQVRCIAESKAGSLKFIQNGNYYQGSAFIAPQSVLNVLPADQGAVFFVYEDDFYLCSIKDTNLYNAFITAAGIYGGLHAIDNRDWLRAAAAAIAAFITPGSDDDYIGEIILDACTDPNGTSHNSVIINGSSRDGCATVETR
ncbi:MAG: hypothetical protein ABR559_00245 [Gemmatimonadota bacterium]